MKTRSFGTTGFDLPVVGQGTWNMEARPEASIRALRRGLDLGLTHVDTAEMYGDGRVEELVGRAVEGRRDEVFLVSKILPRHASRRGTVEACERSLRRLGTDRLDAYLLHWLGTYPPAETVEAFEELVEAGKIRSWGVSNLDEVKLEEFLGVSGGAGCACDQVLYHLEERSVEHAVIPFCQEREIAVVAYSPFGSGAFPAAESPGGRALAEVAAAHDASPYQVALAFLLRAPGTFVIPKASSEAHVEYNARAADLELGDDEIATIDAAFPRGSRRPGVPTL